MCNKNIEKEKKMKFVHIADMHFDRPFTNLSDKALLGNLRRMEQRKVFKKVIEYIKQNQIEYLFISGDLYEHKYVTLSTIEYINQLFKEISETKIFISPGNHDPLIKNSYYHQYKWNENVKIFQGSIERVEEENIDIYGYGFDDFYCADCGIQFMQIEDFNKINVLVIHGTIDGASVEDKPYNSMTRKILQDKHFDYIALGHIHKPDYGSKITYPGSTVSLGFDELGEHGMIVGNLEKGNLQLDFVPLDEEQFKEIEIDITAILSKEELVEKINDLAIENNEYVKVILKGNRNFEINIYELLKYRQNERIIKIKNQTKIAYNLEKVSNENTLKGIFIKKMMEKLNQIGITDEEKDVIEKAVEIGMESLE